MKHSKTAINTEKAPKALGPYSQAVRFGDLLFMSGQIPLDPASGNLVSGGIVEQTERVIRNMQGVLESQGLDLSHVLKVTVFLKNMEDFGKFNEVYGKFFPAPYPGRSTVEVARLPKDVQVEIESIAFYAAP